MQPYSRFGGTRKCFYEFQMLANCHTSANTKNVRECLPAFEDYNECLHGLKERAKARVMMEQLAKNEETGKGVTAKELYKKSNQIYENLNLVTQSD
ncbi:hypothetical protein PVL30_002073 [Lodderomyces elongisporus]|uniref:uncharacterized protein n=1 Tax=Lodderomyces elongisporus TaxID=36914 RepID=UPI00291FD564|nr:uncharacterized protein PVL30_002073 [Lodderomyces elongisporus]WLF78339.1 hypothetical protein PVL30_002073 [Lodderomyces elongisporus]